MSNIITTGTARMTNCSPLASLPAGLLILPISAIVRLLAVAVGFLIVPGLLMSFTLTPETPIDTAAKLQTQHHAIPSVYTPIDRAQLAIQPIPDFATTWPVPAPELRSNEFTRHLNVVALHSASNAELQIITNTTNAFSGRIDQLQLVATDLIDSPSRKFNGVGYPQIEIIARSKTERFRPLITYVDLDIRNQPIPNVRCMGLSPRAVNKRAKRYSKSVGKLATRYSIDANLVRAVMTRESCFDNSARSSVGAMGLMQLMPETAAWLKVDDPTDARQNLRAGVRYLASLKKRFGTNELALAAYNAGPGNVVRHNGIPPFEETRHYVKSVMSHYRSYVATEQFTSAIALN
ncbi:MAG: lytic transglycosylase domain-containing protein [Granulosicoccaceae bacterium]